MNKKKHWFIHNHWMLFFIWNEQIMAIRDGTLLLCKTKTKLSKLGRIKQKKWEIFIEQPILCGSYGYWGPQSIWLYFQTSSLGFDCMFCSFFKWNMGSVLNTVYGWTRSHSLTLLLPSPHISMRGVIILQLAGQQYIVPLSEMGWGGCFALTPHWRLNWHSAATQCSATHKHTGCNQQSSAWFCVFNPQPERLLQKDFKPPSHAEVSWNRNSTLWS